MIGPADETWAGFEAAVRLQVAGRLDEAEAAWRSLLARAPEIAEAHTNLGGVLKSLGRVAEAAEAHRQAVRLNPRFAQAWFNLGVVEAWRRRWAEAEAAFRRTLAIEPQHSYARLQLAYVLLLTGRFQAGWAAYEARREIPGRVDRLDLPEWRGEPLAGKSLAVWPEQGFGDQIQFARYAPRLKAMGARVRLICQRPLLRLFQTLGVEAQAREATTSFERPDYWIPIGSLPGRLGEDFASIDGAPYLLVPDQARAAWVGRAPGGGVGVVWRGNPDHPNDRARSLPSPEVLAPLREAGMALIDLQDPRGDFADTAAILEGLDLVITVDTSMAHLAGALGKPCWVMLAYEGQDWRWFEGRDDSPWYRSVRLFRQPAAGDWASVVAAMAQAWRA
ncbi:tetratricopeptide repeat protein [Phenylobacterium terrae]|uniref:Tetratricopeptide repeat protein n=1 Tax=Phenylobacterium terrae TaxID=2665495 RepID=A0ABW4N810_9CAUL